MRVSVDIADNLYKRIKGVADEEGLSVENAAIACIGIGTQLYKDVINRDSLYTAKSLATYFRDVRRLVKENEA